jgi:hypothetical protein
MSAKIRVTYTEIGEPKVVCVPQGGFPLERLRGYVERCRAKQPFLPSEIADFARLLCDDGLLSAMTQDEQQFVALKVKPTVNAFLQSKAREIRAARELN